MHFDDAPGHAVTAVMIIKATTDGTIEAGADGLMITGATELRLTLVTETDFVDALTPPHGDLARLRDRALARVTAVAERPYDQLRSEHVAEHRSWFDRFALELGDATGDDPDTDELLARALAGDVAPRLVALLVAYGRYLLIAGSRGVAGSQAGLQGTVERPRAAAVERCNYTTNINLEMNYWPAGGRQPRRVSPGRCSTGWRRGPAAWRARGWPATCTAWAAGPCTTTPSPWCFGLPAGMGGEDQPCWSFWPLAGAWLSRHVWEHYDFTRDTEFLARARLADPWRTRRRSAWTGWCERPDGTLGTSPSTSPENKYVAADGLPAAVTVSATADLVLIRDLLANLIRLAAVLPVPPGAADEDLVARAGAALPRNWPAPRADPPTAGLAEWPEDVADAEPEHRHTSHLIGVYPGTSVDPRRPAETGGGGAAHARRRAAPRRPAGRWPGGSRCGPGCGTPAAARA